MRPAPMNRLDATRSVVAWLRDGDAVVASLGHPAYDLYAANDRPANFYTGGSMGLASSIGLGLAMAQPDRRIVVLDGDGSLLMNLGSPATLGWIQPKNLIVIVWDNALYGTTGGQDTATAHGADLAAAARAMNISAAITGAAAGEVGVALKRADGEPGPWVIVARVGENTPATKPPLDCVFIKQRFMSAIGSPESATLGKKRAYATGKKTGVLRAGRAAGRRTRGGGDRGLGSRRRRARRFPRAGLDDRAADDRC